MNEQEQEEQKNILRLNQLSSDRLMDRAKGMAKQKKEADKYRASRKNISPTISAKTAKNMVWGATKAFNSINFSEDGIYFAIILISIAADVVTAMVGVVAGFFALIPLVGIAVAETISIVASFFFCIVVWVLYMFAGHFKFGRLSAKKRNAKILARVGSNVGAQALEMFGAGLNVLPFFTASAFFNYGMVLIERGAKKAEEKSEGKKAEDDNTG